MHVDRFRETPTTNDDAHHLAVTRHVDHSPTDQLAHHLGHGHNDRVVGHHTDDASPDHGRTGPPEHFHFENLGNGTSVVVRNVRRPIRRGKLAS